MNRLLSVAVFLILPWALLGANITILNAIPSNNSIDILMNNQTVVQSLAYKALSNTFNVKAGIFNIVIKQSQSNSVIATASNVTIPDANITAIAVSRPGLPNTVIFLNEPFPANNSVSLTRLVHVAPIGSSPPTVSMRVGNATVFPVVQFLRSSGYFAFRPQSNATVDIFQFSDQKSLAKQTGVQFSTGQATTFFLMGDDAGFPATSTLYNENIPANIPDPLATPSTAPTASATPETPSETPKPTGTPKPTKTPGNGNGGGNDHSGASSTSMSFFALVVASIAAFFFSH